MKKIRLGLLAVGMMLCTVTSVTAQVNISIGLPRVSIGINLPLFPELVPVPGYPVYYAPRLDSNYFFYDGLYWVYQDDNWYSSSWYNGPWWFIEPEYVPLFILRVPVRYYRHHPVYFRGWRDDAPPRWGEHWGGDWERRRSGWDRWERRSAPAPAPLPVYQREYSGDRYPGGEEQQKLQRQKYRYEPRDAEVRQHYQRQVEQKAPQPAQQEMREEPERRSPRQESQPSPSRRQDAPDRTKAQPSSRGGDDNVQRATPAQAPQEQRSPSRDRRQQAITTQPDRQPPTAQEQRAPARDQRQPVAEQRERQAPTVQEPRRGSQTREQPKKAKRPGGKDQKQDEEEERDRERERNR